MKRPPREQIIEVLEQNGGLLRSSAQKMKVSRTALYKWIEADASLSASLDSIREGMIDFAEGKLFKLIQDENPQAIFFYLKTIGRKRGYTERLETDITSGGRTIKVTLPTVQVFDYSKLSDDALQEIAAQLPDEPL